MKFENIALATVLALMPMSPALAVAPVAKPTAAATQTDDEKALDNLKARITKAKALWTQLKGLKGLTTEATKAQIAKIRAGLKELKAEGKAGKNLILSGIVRKIEADLDKMDPIKKSPTP